MALDGLDNVLRSLTRQPGWESYRRYARAIEAWQQAVSPRILEQTRPFALQQGALSVATRSAALAQDLSLQRYSLIQKINRFLDEPIEELHFSSARWFERSPLAPEPALDPASIERHPSYFSGENGNSKGKEEEGETPRSQPFSGFERWTEKIHRRSLRWPLCPRCQSPTPPGEIERWRCCAFCSVRAPGDRP